MNKKIFLAFLFFILFFGISFAEDVLTFDEFLNSAIKNNPRYQISAKEYLAALQENKSAHSLEDWNLVASAVYNESYPAATSLFSPTYQRTYGYSVGVEKYFLPTGTAFQIEHSNSRIQSDYSAAAQALGLSSSPYYLSNVSLTISQPLLRNAFGLTAKLGLETSDFALKLAEIKLKEDWEGFISQLRNDYLDWQKAYQTLRNQKKQLKSVKQQLILVKRQRGYGLSEDLDVVQTEQMEAAYEILQGQAEMIYRNQSRKIASLMNPNFIDLKAAPQELTRTPQLFGEEPAKKYLFSMSNILKTTDLLVSIQKNSMDIAKNAELPDVNLVLAANPNAYESSFSKSLPRIGENQDYTISISTSRGLANDQASAGAKKAQADYMKSVKEREIILLNSKIALQSLYTNIKYMDNMITLSGKNTSLARKRLDLEKRKMQQGRTSVFFVLQAENALLDAENKLNESLVAREKVVNQINSLTDRYVEQYKAILKL
ncbi:MAG: TolC family protein [Candidatus Saganbacteria bacterium]|nr:TolC family protein [Candidatus Saganbacteria bacterium]